MRYLKQKRYYENNKEKIQEQDRARSQTPEFKKRVSEYNKKYRRLPHVIEARRKYNQMYRKKHSERLKKK